MTIVNVRTGSASFTGPQCSQSPANRSSVLSGAWMKYGCLFGVSPFHSKYPCAGNSQRRDLKAPRKIGFESTVSARALIALLPAGK